MKSENTGINSVHIFSSKLVRVREQRLEYYFQCELYIINTKMSCRRSERRVQSVIF